jgi:hypothetical protein
MIYVICVIYGAGASRRSPTARMHGAATEGGLTNASIATNPVAQGALIDTRVCASPLQYWIPKLRADTNFDTSPGERIWTPMDGLAESRPEIWGTNDIYGRM